MLMNKKPPEIPERQKPQPVSIERDAVYDAVTKFAIVRGRRLYLGPTRDWFAKRGQHETAPPIGPLAESDDA
jgi:hypothetical protein